MMTCKVCPHPQRDAIEAAVAQGIPYRTIAAQFGSTSSGLQRHVKKCQAVANEAKAVIQAVRSGSLVEVVAEMRARFMASFTRRSDLDIDEMSMTDLAKETARIIELEAKLTGQLAPKKAEPNAMTAAEQLAYIDRMRPLLLEQAAAEATTVIEVPKPER